MLHAEGVLLMEEARAAAAAILALRDNSARPLLGALPVFLSEDGSRPRTGPPMLRPPRTRAAAVRGRGPGGVFVSAGRVCPRLTEACSDRTLRMNFKRLLVIGSPCCSSPKRQLQLVGAVKR